MIFHLHTSFICYICNAYHWHLAQGLSLLQCVLYQGCTNNIMNTSLKSEIQLSYWLCLQNKLTKHLTIFEEDQ